MAPIELLNIDAIEVGLVPGNLVNFHVDCIWQGVVVAFDVDYLEQTFMSFISVLAKSGKLLNQVPIFTKAYIVSAALTVYGAYPLNLVLLDPDQMNYELHLLHSVIAFGEEKSGVADYVSTA